MRHLIKNFLPEAIATRLCTIALNSKLHLNNSDTYDHHPSVKNPACFSGILQSEKIPSPSMSAHIESKLLDDPLLSDYGNIVFPYSWSYEIYPKDAFHDWHIDDYGSTTPQQVDDKVAYTATLCLTTRLTGLVPNRLEFKHGQPTDLTLGDCLVFDGSSTFNTHRICVAAEGPMVILTNYAYYI